MQDADTLKSRVERYRSENSIVCPRCGSTWHKTTLRCNCGYEFLPRHSPEVPQDSRLRRLFWPSIYDSDSARRAGMNGAQASFLVAGVTTLFALLSMVGVISVVEPWAIVDAVIVASLGPDDSQDVEGRGRGRAPDVLDRTPFRWNRAWP